MAKKEKKEKKKDTPTPKARVHQDLSGFEVSINKFGEIEGNMNIERSTSSLTRMSMIKSCWNVMTSKK